MAYKHYGYESFRAKVDGIDYLFRCWSEGTRYGFRHVCEVDESRDEPWYFNPVTVRVSCAYYNRTWERFTYESVLEKAVERFDKSIVAELRAQIVDRTAKAEHERCEAEFSAFKTAYDAASPELKNALKNTAINNEADAKFVTALCTADALIRGALK